MVNCCQEKIERTIHALAKDQQCWHRRVVRAASKTIICTGVMTWCGPAPWKTGREHWYSTIWWCLIAQREQNGHQNNQHAVQHISSANSWDGPSMYTLKDMHAAAIQWGSSLQSTDKTCQRGPGMQTEHAVARMGMMSQEECHWRNGG